jgi:hypothetical protein
MSLWSYDTVQRRHADARAAKEKAATEFLDSVLEPLLSPYLACDDPLPVFFYAYGVELPPNVDWCDIGIVAGKLGWDVLKTPAEGLQFFVSGRTRDTPTTSKWDTKVFCAQKIRNDAERLGVEGLLESAVQPYIGYSDGIPATITVVTCTPYWLEPAQVKQFADLGWDIRPVGDYGTLALSKL